MPTIAAFGTSRPTCTPRRTKWSWRRTTTACDALPVNEFESTLVTRPRLTSVQVGGRPLPRLADLLDAFPDVRFNVDPKADSAVRPLVDLLRTRDALDRVCVASFSDRRLRWVRAALGEHVCTAAGPREIRVALSQLARGAEIWIPVRTSFRFPGC